MPQVSRQSHTTPVGGCNGSKSHGEPGKTQPVFGIPEHPGQHAGHVARAHLASVRQVKPFRAEATQ
jgi:hypothetical protein